ncbi:MAG: subtilisin family serine protease [Salibacteraceae bacterium]|jgi:subtilisin family serine protease
MGNEPINQDSLQWWHNNFGLPEIWGAKGIRGQGIKIAILDSGININHVEFGKNKVIYSKKQSDKDPIDRFGHGTNCASVAGAKEIGVAPDVELIIGKVYNSPGDGYYADELSEAIRNVVKLGANVISLSLGGTTDQKDKKLIGDAIDFAFDNQVVVVAAIGNKVNSSAGLFPGTYKNCISIGSINESREISAFTIKASELDICAPGENIYAASIKYKFKEHTNSIEENTFYSIVEGTSIATPFVAGVIALMLSSKKYSPSDIKKQLIENSDSMEVNGFIYRVINPKKIFNIR